jgi:hypothetical protein
MEEIRGIKGPAHASRRGERKGKDGQREGKKGDT